MEDGIERRTIREMFLKGEREEEREEGRGGGRGERGEEGGKGRKDVNLKNSKK